MAQDYVLGFAFNPDLSKVVLIRKNRPSWQAGMLNGVGGKIELNEEPFDAMCREFYEEAGVGHRSWELFSQMAFGGGLIYCYRTIMNIELVSSMTDEPIVIFDTMNIMGDPTVLHNLKWMIPYAMFDTSEYVTTHFCSNLPNNWQLTENLFK